MIVYITYWRVTCAGIDITCPCAVGNRTRFPLRTAVIRVIWFARRAVKVMSCLTICGLADRSITQSAEPAGFGRTILSTAIVQIIAGAVISLLMETSIAARRNARAALTM